MKKAAAPEKTHQLKINPVRTICPIEAAAMTSTQDQNSLYLHPTQAGFTVDHLPAFIHSLQTIGLITHKIDTEKTEQHYFTGEKYLDYIAYMGCAPSIQFEAGAENKNFCFIKIQQHPEPQLIHSQKQSRAPHCPHCNKPVKNWQDKKTAAGIHCDLCDNTSGIEEFKWRKMAGYAQLFIEVTDIFPKEAIPQQALLDKLAAITDTKWQYFYSCQYASI